MKATTNQADPWKRPNRDDQWARVDYRSRAVAIICAIATTLVVAVTLTAYVATQVGFAEGALLPTPPREAAFVAPQCPPRYVHQIFGLKGDDEEVPTAWRRAQKTWMNRHRAVEVEDPVVLAPGAIAEEWKYVLWSKDAVDALIRTDYPHLWATYRSYPRWVQRADMARYAILHKYGGLYADLDVMARRSWEPIRALCPELVVARADQFGPFLSPDTMLARAGSPFLKHVLETMPAKATSLPRRLLGPFLSVLATTGPVHLTESFLEYRSAHDVAAGNIIIIGDGYYTGRVTPRKLVGHLRGRSWHERDAFAGRPRNMVVVPVVSSFVWIAAACCCALRRRRQQRRLSGKGV